MSEKTPETILFEQVQEVDDSALMDIPEEKRKPRMGDPEWTDYVLSLLTPKEVIDNKGTKLPKTDGLRRITNKVLGRVIRSESSVDTAVSQANNFTATVSHTLDIEVYGHEETLRVTGVADASTEHLPPPFNKYPTANASTKAMGRAYRDALQLQVCVAEELNNISDMLVVDDLDDAGPAEAAQKKAIQMTCKRLGIDVDLFINSGPFSHKSIDKVLRGTARKMMAVLNGYQQGTDIPPEILLKGD